MQAQWRHPNGETDTTPRHLEGVIVNRPFLKGHPGWPMNKGMDSQPPLGLRRNDSSRSLSPALAGILAGVVVATVFAVLVFSAAESRSHVVEANVAAAAHSIEQGVEQAILKLETIDGFFQASDDVTPEALDVFTDSLDLERDPDSIAVALRVPGEDLSRVTDELSEWYGAVDLFQLRDGQHVPLEPSRQHYIVTYHRPPPGESSIVGFDALSQVERHNAILVATATDTVAISTFFRLVDSQEQDGFVLAAPVHDSEGSQIGVAFASGTASSMVSSWVPESVREEATIEVIGMGGSEPARSTWLNPTATDVAVLSGRTWVIAAAPAHVPHDLLWLVAVGTVAALVAGFGIAALGRSLQSRRSLEVSLSSTQQLARERQRAIDALSDFELLARNSTDIIIRADPDLTYRYVSPAIETLLGYSPQELTGTKPWDRLHPDEVSLVRTAVNRLTSGGADTIDVEYRYRHAEGHWVWLHTIGRAIRDEGGNLREVQAASRDVTDQVEQREALAEARAATERVAAEKAQFLATVSHEIRTPLTAVAGLSEVLGTTDLDEEQRECVETIRAASRTVVSLVTDLLDLSKAEVGRLAISRAPFNLRDTVGGVVRLLEQEAASRALDLTVEIDEDVPEVVVGDPHRLQQILVNLVGNALKFTAEGSVTVCAARSDSGSPTDLRIEVRDTGIGIPGDRLDAIFEFFEQGDASTAGEYGGTGLGLGISRQLVVLMDGHIGVHSVAGEGSTFWFELPLPQVEPDSADSCRVVGRPLERAGLVAVLRAAGWLVDERDDPEPGAPNQVLVGAAGGIEESMALSGIVVVDTSPQRGNCQLVEEKGAAGYLGNPVTAGEIKDLLERVQPGTFVTRHGSCPPESEAFRLKVLVADDSPSNLMLLERLLSRRGHEVVAVADGARAWEAFQSDPYDVVVVDGRMPGMTGVEVATAIRAQEKTSGRRARIIMVSGLDSRQDHEEAMAAGVDLCLTKPVDSERLFAAVESQVPNDRQAAPGQGPDLSGLREHLEEMPEVAEELIAAVREEWAELAAIFTAESVAADLEAVGAAAHRLRGALGFVDDPSTIEVARRVETAAREGDVSTAGTAVAVLTNRMTELDQELEGFLGAVVAGQPNR